MEIAATQSGKEWNRGRLAYVCFLACGLCALVNLFAYLPAKDFLGGEAIEFLVTVPLIPIFLIFALVGIAGTAVAGVHNDRLLLVLLLGTVLFLIFAFYRGGMSSQIRQTEDVVYAGYVTVLSVLGLVLKGKRPVSRR